MHEWMNDRQRQSYGHWDVGTRLGTDYNRQSKNEVFVITVIEPIKYSQTCIWVTAKSDTQTLSLDAGWFKELSSPKKKVASLEDFF